MILVRDIFRLKYGKARDAKESWKEGMKASSDFSKIPHRVLTDITGTAYTFVFESTYKNLGEFEETAKKIMSNNEWKNWYSKFVPLVETSYREIFTIVEE